MIKKIFESKKNIIIFVSTCFLLTSVIAFLTLFFNSSKEENETLSNTSDNDPENLITDIEQQEDITSTNEDKVRK